MSEHTYKQKIQFYNIVIYLALMGKTRESDDAIKRERELFLEGRNNFMESHNITYPIIKTENIHRGWLLEDQYIKKENNLLYVDKQEIVKTISYSEDYEIAKEFADTESKISSFVMRIKPGSKGYVSELDSRKLEKSGRILFHYDWIKYIDKELRVLLDEDLIEEQKEIIVLNDQPRENIFKYEKEIK